MSFGFFSDSAMYFLAFIAVTRHRVRYTRRRLRRRRRYRSDNVSNSGLTSSSASGQTSALTDSWPNARMSDEVMTIQFGALPFLTV